MPAMDSNTLAFFLALVSVPEGFCTLSGLLSGAVTPFLPRNPIKSVSELVVPHGYPLEEHAVTTADGYVLAVYRIPRGRSSTSPRSFRPPVILQHGISYSCASFLVNGPHRSLGFVLADAGYDVWLSNSRGNVFSRGHTRWTDRSDEFWDFTLDHTARGDLPAVIAYVRNVTGAPSVAFVGHSEGATLMLAALAADPGLQTSVSLAVLFGPIVSLQHSTSGVMVARYLNNDKLQWVLGHRGTSFLENSLAMVIKNLCVLAYPVCVALISSVTGYNTHNVDREALMEYFHTYPGGTSFMTFKHWIQMMSKGPQLSHYDYGTRCGRSWWTGKPRLCNQRVYGTTGAPLYDFGVINTTRMAVFAGGLDKLASPEDVAELVGLLQPSSVVYLEHIPTYGHLDFCWGADAGWVLHAKVVDLIRTYGTPGTTSCTSSTRAQVMANSSASVMASINVANAAHCLH